MSVDVVATESPRAVFKEKDLAMIMNMDITFKVNNEIAIVVTLTDLNAHVDVTLRNEFLTSQVKVVKIDQCTAS